MWFDKLEYFNSVLRAKLKEEGPLYEHVRVAVLDTGLNESLIESVKDYKDFVTGDDSTCIDNTGHGTNAVRLLQKVYLKADIYVGRTFEDSQAAANTASLMAKVRISVSNRGGYSIADQQRHLSGHPTCRRDVESQCHSSSVGVQQTPRRHIPSHQQGQREEHPSFRRGLQLRQPL